MSFIQKKLFIFTILCLSLFQLTGCLFGDSDEKKQMPPSLVYVGEVKKVDTPYNWNFQAQTQGSKSVEVRSRVSGIIEERLYVEGEYVEQGQQLFQIERDQYEAIVQQARAEVYRTRREWTRILSLYKKNAVSQKDRDNAKAGYDSAAANLRAAKINLDYCQVVSPVSGYSTQEELTPGNLVNNNSLLTKVNKTDPLYVNFAIANSFMQIIKKFEAQGRISLPENNRYDAKIHFIDGGVYDTAGIVTYMSKQVEAMTGAIKARAEFANLDGKILPGQFVRVYISGAVLTDAIVIPQRAVMMTQGANIVMVVGKDNKVTPTPIEILQTLGDSYLVGEGLSGGESIIIEGIIKVRPGQVVNPVPIEDKGKKKSTKGKEAGKSAKKDKSLSTTEKSDSE